MSTLSVVKAVLTEVIAGNENILKENDKESFYDLFRDEDGVPYSYGNSDDVFSDGFLAGEYCAQSELAKRILQLIDEYEKLEGK